MVDCILVLIILTGMTGLGMFILGLFKELEVTRAEKIILSCGLGFGLIGYVFFLLGLSHNMNSSLSWIILIALAILAIPVFIANKIKPAYSWLPSISNLGKIEKVIVLMVFCILIVVFLNQFSLYVGGDSIQAYLRIAKIIAVDGKITHWLDAAAFTPGNHISYTHVPLLAHMVYVFCFLLKGDLLARLMHFSIVISIILAIYIFSQRWFDKTVAFYSTIAFLTMTGVVNWASEVRVDFPLVFMFVLCYYALFRYYEDKDVRWLCLGAIFLGFACSIKTNAIIGLLIILLVLIVEAKVKLKWVILFSLIVIIIAAPFYIRSYILMGNPFWPYFNGYFSNVRVPAINTLPTSIKSLFVAFLLSPKAFFLDVGRSALLLSYLPLLFFVKEERHRNLKLLFYCFISITVVFVLPPSLRHSMFVWPLLCLLIGLVMSRVEKGGYFYAVVNKIVLLMCVLFSIVQVGAHSIDSLPSAVGMESREHFLSRIPSLGVGRVYKIYLETGLLPFSEQIRYVFSEDNKIYKYYEQYYDCNIITKWPNYDLNAAKYVISDREIANPNLKLIWHNVRYYIYKKVEE